jgi:oligoribonuclease
MAQDPGNLVWIDLEMTGLDPERDHIIEIATVVTDSSLNVIEEGPELALHQPATIMAGMDEWNTTHHRASGLTDRVRHSTCTVVQAEVATLAFLERLVPGSTSPMCGNSVCQDRRFLARHMPRLERFFHYRNLDVSSLKIVAQRWSPVVAAAFTKRNAHRARQDVHESIRELAHYRRHLLRLP